MYSNYRLDSPPPDSRFRRPWSPDPHDAFPTISHAQAFRGEPTDVSVDALDLADYAQTLPRNPYNRLNFEAEFQLNDPYSSYPPSPRAIRPFSRASVQSPSLMSPGGTLSTASSPRSPRRPFSLPPPSVPHSLSHGYSPRIGPVSDYDHLDSRRQQDEETEADIGNFPAFSRHWYKKDKPLTQPPLSAYHTASHEDGISPFDPSYKCNPLDRAGFSDLDKSLSSSSRTLLPWANGAQDQSMGPIDNEVKQERIHMLQREFGGIGKPGNADEQDNIIGSVDQRGRLITDGPKKRSATRWLQAIATLGTAISVIYASLVTKPKTPPPPQGTLPVYVLYVLSVITFLFIVYLCLIYPSCCLGRRNKSSNLTDPSSGPGAGMIVLPVQHLPGGSKHKGDKTKGKKGKGGMGGDVQVNLIVDPTMFGGGRGSDEEGEEEESWAHGSNRGRRTEGRSSRTPKRMGVFAGLAMEERWKTARKLLKWSMAFDICCFLLWGIEFFLIMLGKRCPPGQFAGWCDAYNFATALTCIAWVLFGVFVFFDIKDLHASSTSPRTRI